MTMPTFTLNNGVRIPATGFGVFQTPPDQTAAAVQAALKAGYRHIDTAASHANERGVGEGLRASSAPREIDIHRGQGVDFGLRVRQNAARF
jgi:diketogulonate reductase-like aldo/keto reductase